MYFKKVHVKNRDCSYYFDYLIKAKKTRNKKNFNQ